jgi:hypothetical protein
VRYCSNAEQYLRPGVGAVVAVAVGKGLAFAKSDCAWLADRLRPSTANRNGRMSIKSSYQNELILKKCLSEHNFFKM